MSSRWNSGRLESISAIVSPRRRPSLSEAAAGPAHPLGVLAPGELDRAALGAQRDLVGTLPAAVAWKAAPTVAEARRVTPGGRYPPLNGRRPAAQAGGGWAAVASAASGVSPTRTRRALSSPNAMTRWTGAVADSPW